MKNVEFTLQENQNQFMYTRVQSRQMHLNKLVTEQQFHLTVNLHADLRGSKANFDHLTDHSTTYMYTHLKSSSRRSSSNVHSTTI